MSYERVPSWLAAGDLVYRNPPVASFLRAQGVSLWDEEGNEYLDGEACNGAAALGYDSSILHEAASQAANLPAVPSFCESELRLRVAHRLEELFSTATGQSGRVSFEVGGAQAIEAAMRVVAAHRGPKPVMVLAGGYHGRSPFTAHLSASHRYRAVQPWPGPDIIRLKIPECQNAAPDCDGSCMEDLRSLGVSEASGVPNAAQGGIACLIIEPFLNVGGSLMPDSTHLTALVDHARSLGALIVVDEIFTGMHRLGPRWGFQLHGIQPDIVVASKALTNGTSAFGCVWAREPLSAPDKFPPGTHSSTFAGNPLALSIATVVLDRFADEAHWTDRVRTLHDTLASATEHLHRHNIIESIEVHGALVRAQLRRPAAMDVRTAASAAKGRDGLLLASTGMAPDILSLHPPLTISTPDVDRMAVLLTDALDRVSTQG